jgi:hypothetical protein
MRPIISANQTTWKGEKEQAGPRHMRLSESSLGRIPVETAEEYGQGERELK